MRMPVDTTEIIELLCTLAEEERLRVTITETLKGGLIAGGCAVAGGILLGPIGLAVGGAVGGGVAAVAAHNKFLPAVQVIATMDIEKRERLAQQIRTIMANVDVMDIAAFAAVITGNYSIRSKVIMTLVDYMRRELSMSIVEH